MSMARAVVMVVALTLTGSAIAKPPPPTAAHQARALALDYLEQGNRLWATRVLLEQLESDPTDLETFTWAVWLLLVDGDLDRARSLLDWAGFPDAGPLRGRLELLEIVFTRLSGEPEDAALYLQEFEAFRYELYPEDIALYDDLRADLLGRSGDPLSARMLFAGGYTSNAVQSAPQDAGAGLEDAGAGVLSADLVLRWEPWASTWVRPLGEARVKAFTPLSEGTRGLGYVDLAGRAGGEIGEAGGFRVRLLYSYEQLGIRDKGWYMAAHRGEIEVDLLPGVQLFAGGGRRIYEHLPRTRIEVDGGMAAATPLGGGWHLTGIVAGRVQRATHEAFDDRGLTGLVRLRVPLPAGAMIKLRVLGSVDVYPDSEEYYGEQRRDGMIRAEVGPWTPPLWGWRVGGTYGLAHRGSSVETFTDDFTYTDHRVLLQVRWEGGFDARRPRRAHPGRRHQVLPWGLAGDAGLDRVQDLLRQEDAARRGSQCVD
jgi:hypothetical protein